MKEATGGRKLILDGMDLLSNGPFIKTALKEGGKGWLFALLDSGT